MKRVIYVLTLALFLLGLIVPAVSYAGNSERSSTSATCEQSSLDERSIQCESASVDGRLNQVWNALLGSSLHLINWASDRVFVHGPGAAIVDREDEPERPLFVDTPDWWWWLEMSDRPDIDDNGWSDIK